MQAGAVLATTAIGGWAVMSVLVNWGYEAFQVLGGLILL